MTGQNKKGPKRKLPNKLREQEDISLSDAQGNKPLFVTIYGNGNYAVLNRVYAVLR